MSDEIYNVSSNGGGEDTHIKLEIVAYCKIPLKSGAGVASAIIRLLGAGEDKGIGVGEKIDMLPESVSIHANIHRRRSKFNTLPCISYIKYVASYWLERSLGLGELV